MLINNAFGTTTGIMRAGHLDTCPDRALGVITFMISTMNTERRDARKERVIRASCIITCRDLSLGHGAAAKRYICAVNDAGSY